MIVSSTEHQHKGDSGTHANNPSPVLQKTKGDTAYGLNLIYKYNTYERVCCVYTHLRITHIQRILNPIILSHTYFILYNFFSILFIK
jgi:hypothetical protein